jgi:hypothetical protein
MNEEDDRYPPIPKDAVIVRSEDKEGRPYDPGFEKIMDVLGDIHEKIEESKNLSPEEQRKYWDKVLSQPPSYPDNPLGPCKNQPLTCRSITQAFGLLTDLGFGDIQELCDLTVFHEAIDRMDLDECEELLMPKESKEPISNFVNMCLLMNMEEVVRDRLRLDQLDEELIQETFIYFGERGESFSPFSYDWRGPLAEKANKAFKEE